MNKTEKTLKNNTEMDNYIVTYKQDRYIESYYNLTLEQALSIAKSMSPSDGVPMMRLARDNKMRHITDVKVYKLSEVLLPN